MSYDQDQGDFFCPQATQEIIYANKLSRSEQRSLILHLLYTIEANDYLVSFEAVVFQYERGFKCIIDPEDQVYKDAQGVLAYAQKADEEMRPFFEHWKFERISTMTKLILRYAFWELQIKKSDPALVINEAVELAKGFGEADSYRFVHGVLDSFVQRLKFAEKKAESI